MNSTLFYFSGTGNSYLLAQKLHQELPEYELVSIASLHSAHIISVDSESIGFVFPSYCQNVPEVVSEFIGKLHFTADKPYIFCWTNCGGVAGNTVRSFEKLLHIKKQQLAFGHVSYMPDNSIFYQTSPENQQRRFADADKKSKLIAQTVRKKFHKQEKKYPFKLSNFAQSKLLKFLMKYYIRVDDKKTMADKCSGCGKCIKTCPVQNMHKTDNQIIWGKNCVWCYACIHACPNGAIVFGRLNAENKRYVNPAVSAKDFIESNSNDEYRSLKAIYS